MAIVLPFVPYFRASNGSTMLVVRYCCFCGQCSHVQTRHSEQDAQTMDATDVVWWHLFCAIYHVRNREPIVRPHEAVPNDYVSG